MVPNNIKTPQKIKNRNQLKIEKNFMKYEKFVISKD